MPNDELLADNGAPRGVYSPTADCSRSRGPISTKKCPGRAQFRKHNIHCECLRGLAVRVELCLERSILLPELGGGVLLLLHVWRLVTLRRWLSLVPVEQESWYAIGYEGTRIVSSFRHCSHAPRVGRVPKPTASRPTEGYAVSCRFIDEKDRTSTSPTLFLRDGQEGFVSDLRQSPFVTGLTRVTDQETGEVVRNPHIVVLKEGTKVTVAIAGQQPNGAVVDVTVERSKIANLNSKKLDPNTTVQLPHVDTCMKRVIDFVRLGDTLIVRAAGRTPMREHLALRLL